MTRYDTADIYEALEKLGLTPLRLRDGIHVIDSQDRIVAHYSCPIGQPTFWEIWPTPTYPLTKDKLKNAYPLLEEALFQFATVEVSTANKQKALNDMLHRLDSTKENE
ncbi:hypothetical protein [Kosakonia oryzae]|uniref:Uncharacterized protein n=1 Tax=Kosakonia oryzae TaxID=497725 RepID=A0ABX7PY43_9ENTR|nr:hypothetical protein [Kosakonia oryzae]QSV12315.1 hypothetical protein AWR26_25005 [Kosakonia oryzae]